MRDDLRWTRSTKCGSNACVEVASSDDNVLVRDSKHPERNLRFTTDAWRGFTDGIRAGDFANL